MNLRSRSFCSTSEFFMAGGLGIPACHKQHSDVAHQGIAKGNILNKSNQCFPELNYVRGGRMG